MDDKETYGVVVEAKTNLFKKAIQELSGMIKNFGKVAEEETTVTPKFVINPNIKLKELYKWREDLQKEIDKTQEDMTYLKGSPTQKFFQEDLDRYKDGLEAVNYRINELEGTQNGYNNELEETNEELDEIDNASKRTSNSLKSMLDGGISKIKRFTYYLLGARSVFSLFMKYQSIYYQYNEKMQYQSELSQNAIALSLAPAFEFLGNMIAYASIGFAKFIELLTGVNVLSKVTTKGIRDYNKSLKETQTLVSGIDEVTNLSLPSGTGLASQYKALDDFQKKVAEVTKWFNENTWISDIAKGLKNVYNYVKEHWDIFKYILGGVAIGLLSKSFTFGITVTGLAVFLEFISALKEYNKAKEEYDKNHQDTHDLILKNFKEITNNYLKQMTKEIKNTEKGTKKWKLAVDDVKKQLPSILNEIRNGELTYEEYGPVIQEWIDKLTDLDSETFEPEINFLTKLDGNEDDLELIKNYFEIGKNYVNKFSNFSSGGGRHDSKELNYKVNVDSTQLDDLENQAKKTFKYVSDILDNTFKEKVFKISLKYNIDKNSVINLANKVVGLSSMLGVPSSTINNLKNNILKNFGYAKGLDYVPYDNYPALLHKGEAVVPAKYNPTIHSEGNEYTNSLLETVVMKLDDLSRKPTILNIDGQQFANATYELYEEARNNQNYVEGVVR